MRKYTFEASKSFKELLERIGPGNIRTVDIREEAIREGVVYKCMESWTYKEGILSIYVEEKEGAKHIDSLLEKQVLSKKEIEFLEYSPFVEVCEYVRIEDSTGAAPYLFHVMLYGDNKLYRILTNWK